MTARRLLISAIVGCGTACSIFTDLSGLSGGATGVGASDGGDAALETGVPEASADGGDGGDGRADATADAAVRSYSAEVLSDKPIAYLRFGETAGVLAHDETGNGNQGAVSGTVTWGVPGALARDGDTAVRLDGTTSQIDLGGAIDFAGTAPFSLEIWFNVATVDTTYRFLLGKDTQPTSGREEWGVVIQSVDGLYFERYIAGSGRGAGTAAQPLVGRWVHTVSTYDGMTLAFYVDGALVDQSLDPRSQLAKNVSLYAGSDGAGRGVIDGALDELAIYDFALSATRIKAHFDAAK